MKLFTAKCRELATTIGTLSSDDGDAKDDAKKKNEFIFYIRISQIPRSVQYAYRSQNLLKVDIVMPAFNSKPKYEK